MVKGQKTNYQKTIIYKIVCNDLNITDNYVGHTTNWINRKSNHKYSCNNKDGKKYNQQNYQFIRNNGGWDNWSMIEICKYPCNDKREAEAEERRYYELLNSNLNSNKPFTPKEEYNSIQSAYQKKYLEINKEHFAAKRKEKYNNNKEQISENRKVTCYCECGSCIRKDSIQRHCRSKKHQKYLKYNNL